MERRSSNIDASTARQGRRRSAVTIIAPGEEPNPFQCDAVSAAVQKDSTPADSRFDSFKANPRDEVVSDAPAPAPRGLQTTPIPAAAPFPSLAIAPVVPASRIANRTMANSSTDNNNINVNNGGGAGVVSGACNTPGGSSRSAVPAGDQVADVIQLSATKQRMRSLHMFPNTPPSLTAAAAPAAGGMPAQRPPSFRNGSVLVATTPRGSQFPTNPALWNNNGSNTSADTGVVLVAAHAETNAVRPVMRRAVNTPATVAAPPRNRAVSQAVTQDLSRNSSQLNKNVGNIRATPAHVNAPAPYAPAARRGSIPPPPPSPSAAATWASAARRQPLSMSAPSLPMPSNYYEAGGNPLANSGARRATVQLGPSLPQWQPPVELKNVPCPPQRRIPFTASQNDNGSGGSTMTSVPESLSPLLNPAASGTTTKIGNDSFGRFSYTGRESSIVIDDGAIDKPDMASVLSAPKPSPPSPLPPPTPPKQLQPTIRAQSPPADNSDFLKPTVRRTLEGMDLAPMSPQKGTKSKRESTRTSKSSFDSDNESDEATSKATSSGSSNRSNADEKKEGQKDMSSPLGGWRNGEVSPSQPEAPSMLDVSTIIQSPLYFTPLEDRRKGLVFDGKVKKTTDRSRTLSASAAAGNAATSEDSMISFADFGLTNNGTLEPVSLSTFSSTNGQANARLHRSRPVVRLPSPVDLSSTLLRENGTSNSNGANGTALSPLLDISKHRANLAQSHGSNSKTSNNNKRDGLSAGGSPPPVVDKSVSVDDWSFDGLTRNGLSHETEESDVVDIIPPYSMSACSPTSSKANGTVGTKAAKEKWRVTQSLSINPSEFSFDHLPLNQQNSNVAKLRKVFESQRKPKRGDERETSKSGGDEATPAQAESQWKKVSAFPSFSKQTSTSLAVSIGSTMLAPCSDTSSKSSLDDDGDTPAEGSGQSTVMRHSYDAPSLDFSFDNLASPISSGVKKTKLPPLSSSKTKMSFPAQNKKGARTDSSGTDFDFSFGALTEGRSSRNRHSAPSRTTNMKNSDTVLPAVSLLRSQDGFSLARFQNSSASADTVNMFDRYEF